jgi:hypothetical protein
VPAAASSWPDIGAGTPSGCRRAFADAGHTSPTNPARNFLMLRDGAVAAGYLDSPDAAERTFERGVEGLLRPIGLETLPGIDED